MIAHNESMFISKFTMATILQLGENVKVSELPPFPLHIAVRGTTHASWQCNVSYSRFVEVLFSW